MPLQVYAMALSVLLNLGLHCSIMNWIETRSNEVNCFHSRKGTCVFCQDSVVGNPAETIILRINASLASH